MTETRADGPPYSGGMTAGAMLATVFAPFIALVVALILRGQETSEPRREFLRKWAIWSGAWLATGWLIAIIAIASIAGSAGGGGGFGGGFGGGDCRGGIDRFSPPDYESDDAGKTWTATYSCVDGGSKTVSVPRSQVPGGLRHP